MFSLAGYSLDERLFSYHSRHLSIFLGSKASTRGVPKAEEAVSLAEESIDLVGLELEQTEFVLLAAAFNEDFEYDASNFLTEQLTYTTFPSLTKATH